MTSTATLDQFLKASKSVISEAFYADTWRSTSYLINVLGKIERYVGSLKEDNQDTDFFTAEVALSGATNMISDSYKCPVNDERFEKVRQAFEATVESFIADYSDDAMMDLIYLGSMANYVAGMRVHAINRWIEETAPSELKFAALKLAKRDEKAVELAIKALGEVLLGE